MKRRTWLALLVPVLVGCAGLVASGCASDKILQRHEFTRLSMGVQARVVVYAPSAEAATAAAAAAFDTLSRLDAVMSDYRVDSELNRLNAAAGGPAVPVSDDLLAVLSAARAVAEASGGAFDVTVGPMVALWREARRTGVMPADRDLAAALDLVRWDMLVLDEDARTARRRRHGMKLDLGGIGKGFAAQRAVEHLQARGFRRCLVALAGDIVVGDPPPGERGWHVQLGEGHDVAEAQTVLLANAAISTSGDAEQFIEIGGVRYSHIVDPRTGLGVTHGFTATVIAPRGELADALSTAANVLGPEAAVRCLAAFPAASLIWTDLAE